MITGLYENIAPLKHSIDTFFFLLTSTLESGDKVRKKHTGAFRNDVQNCEEGYRSCSEWSLKLGLAPDRMGGGQATVEEESIIRLLLP